MSADSQHIKKANYDNDINNIKCEGRRSRSIVFFNADKLSCYAEIDYSNYNSYGNHMYKNLLPIQKVKKQQIRLKSHHITKEETEKEWNKRTGIRKQQNGSCKSLSISNIF